MDHVTPDRHTDTRYLSARLARHIKQMERADRAIPLRRRDAEPHDDGVGRLTGLVP